MITHNATTLIDAMLESFADSLRAPEGLAAPVALIWTDADGQWRSLLSALREAMPALYCLGDFASLERQGPVIWLKCVVERTVPESPAPGVIPVIYLPNVSRQDLRAGGDCPHELQPMIELLYRGTGWHQKNGRDWTVEAFLGSDTGLGLDVAQDTRTRQALLRSLPLLAIEPLAHLRNRRLESDDFDRLAIGDSIRDLLSWMNAPSAFEKRCDASRWETFKDVCSREFGFSIDEGAQSAADALVNGGGNWEVAWRRFCESPRLYEGLVQLLRQAQPRDLLVDCARRPDINQAQEESLRQELEAVTSMLHAQACAQTLALERRHKERLGWVWAELGESPFAEALEPLARLAQGVTLPVGGTSLNAMASDYALQGWRCDRAAIEALACLKEGKESALVARVVHTLYKPWLEQAAHRFQELISGANADASQFVSGVVAERNTCILFVDGLRLDIGQKLFEKLDLRGLKVRLDHRIAPLPTVTATAKPLTTPGHSHLAGPMQTEDFSPIDSSGHAVTAPRLRNAMVQSGIQVLDKDELRMAVGSQHGGWTEIGQLDHVGHQFSALLAYRVESEVDGIVERVMALLDAGWTKVRVVTDHGWLLLRGGLPKVEVPPYLVETKWARCAVVRGNSASAVPTYPWYWNSQVRIACPPGIGSFRAGTEYAHGGVSPQECIVPEILAERGEEVITARINEILWRGMRCRVSVATTTPGICADLRLNWKQSTSSIVANVKELSESGEVSLAVSDDGHEGAAASVVVVDAAGRILDHQPTIVGESV